MLLVVYLSPGEVNLGAVKKNRFTGLVSVSYLQGCSSWLQLTLKCPFKQIRNKGQRLLGT